VSRVGGSHHVLGIEHLLGEFRHGNGAVLLTAASNKRSKADHEEVKTGEGNQVDGHLAEVRVELTRKLRRYQKLEGMQDIISH